LNNFIRLRIQSTMCGKPGHNLLGNDTVCPLFCSSSFATEGKRTGSNSVRRTKFKKPHPMLLNENQKPVQKIMLEIEPPEVILKSGERSTIQVVDEVKVSNDEWKNETKITDTEPPGKIGETLSFVDAKSKNEHFDRPFCIDSDGGKANDLYFPIVDRRSLSINRDVGLLTPEACTSISMSKIGLASPSSSTDFRERKKGDGCKSLTTSFEELVDGGEYKQIQNGDECQLSSPSRKSVNTAEEIGFPECSCDNLSTSSESGGSNQFSKECLIPSKPEAFSDSKIIDDSQEKVVESVIKDLHVVTQSDQSHPLNIKEQSVNSFKSLDEIESHQVRSPISKINLGNSESKRHTVLSIASVSARDVFARHESLSVHDIFSTTIEDEIPMTHDYLRPSILSPKMEFLPMTGKFLKGTSSDTDENSFISDKSSGSDKKAVFHNSSRGAVSSMDQDYFKNGREFGREANALKSDTPRSRDLTLEVGNVAPHEDKSAEESSWLSPLSGIIGKLI